MKTLTKEELAHISGVISDAAVDFSAQLTRESIDSISVKATSAGAMTLTARDAIKLLSIFEPETEVGIENRLAYALLIQCGVFLNGFKPNKTTLRYRYNLSIDRVNEILPGSYK